MKLARFNDTRLGVVDGDHIADISDALDMLPPSRWPLPRGDQVIAHLDTIMTRARDRLGEAPRLALSDIKLSAPVANPGKIIAAPVNYHDHLDEARADEAIHHGNVVHKIDTAGLFLKANSALAGPGVAIALPFDDRRCDHEAEIVVVIGKTAKKISARSALDHVAGYMLGLDMTVRGSEERSMRKSCDSFAVFGPWLATPDEVADPADIPFELTVNGEMRQQASSALLIRSIPELIEMASAFYTLEPGDIIMTGTPAGVGPVSTGDKIAVTSPALGTLQVSIL